MKRLSAAAVCSVITLAVYVFAPAGAVARDDEAAEFVRSLGNRVLQTLSDKGLTQQDRTQRFYSMFMNSFDSDRISSFALGKYRRSVSPEEFEEYKSLFGKYMTGLYATKFAHYSGETFAVTNAEPVAPGGSNVSAEIRRKQGEPVRIVFKVDREGNDLKIYDVVIEGISLLFAKRQEITSVIARDGMEQLIARLRKAVQLAELG